MVSSWTLQTPPLESVPFIVQLELRKAKEMWHMSNAQLSLNRVGEFAIKYLLDEQGEGKAMNRQMIHWADRGLDHNPLRGSVTDIR